MASLFAAVKRKLAFLSTFVVPAADAQDTITNDDILETIRPTKRQRLSLNAHSNSAEESPHLIVESDTTTTTTTTTTTLQSSLVLPLKNKHLDESSSQSSPLLQMLPPHVLSKCLHYLGDRSNRFALQTTCTLFHQLSNEDGMLANVELGGDWSDSILHSHVDEDIIRSPQPNNALAVLLDAMGVNHPDNDDDDDDEEDVHLQHRYVLTKSEEQSAVKGGILTEGDTSDSACKKLVKFSAAGNMQATYM
jgi:hypothetical protein